MGRLNSERFTVTHTIPYYTIFGQFPLRNCLNLMNVGELRRNGIVLSISFPAFRVILDELIMNSVDMDMKALAHYINNLLDPLGIIQMIKMRTNTD